MTSKDNRPFHKPIKAVLAFLLAWIVPGAGHAFVGRPGRGIIIFIVIGATFWGGIAMGGVMTVDHERQKWWFAAEMVTGVHGLVGWQRASKRLQTLKQEVQAGMAWERATIENSIDNKRKERSECEEQLAQLKRSINATTTPEEENTLTSEFNELAEKNVEIQTDLYGYHAKLNSLRSAHIVKVLAQENLALVAPMATVARAYAGVSGLLNLMCIFDVVMLALIGTVATTAPSNREDNEK